MFGCDEDHLQANSHFMHATFANELGDNALTVLSRFDAGVYEHFPPPSRLPACNGYSDGRRPFTGKVTKRKFARHRVA